MKLTHNLHLISISLISLLMTNLVWANPIPECDDKAKIGTVCLMPVEDLHPTQFAVGNVAVECKRKKIEKKYEKGKLEAYLAARHIPAIIGPDGQYYITDHHHLSTAIYRAEEGSWDGKKQPVYVSILANYHKTGISMSDFWNIMLMQKNVWPYDENGDAVEDYGKALPDMNMGSLQDNPYRTLSRWTRESCGYIKKGKAQCLPLEATVGEPTAPYFMEFYWARFLREQLQDDNDELDTPKKLKKQYAEAIAATLDKQKTDAFFKAQQLNAINYGQNQEGTYLYLEFNKHGCEQWWLDAED